jgi:acetoin utilization protein AcuB
MTSFPYFVEASDPAGKLEKIMDDRSVRHLPVQEKGRVVGIVSERDLHHRMQRGLPAAEKSKLRARDLMVADPYVVGFKTPLDEVVAQMAIRHIGSAVVVRRGKLAGILSAIDVCRIFAEYLDHWFARAGGHDAA